MSEELRDELSRVAAVHRLKIMGFGGDTVPFAGSAAGVTNRQTIQYQGVGCFLATGIMLRGVSLTTWAGTATPKQFSWSVLDQNQKPLLSPSWKSFNNFNEVFENLDHGVLLQSQEYLIIEVTSLTATSFQFGGIIWGEEFLF